MVQPVVIPASDNSGQVVQPDQKNDKKDENVADNAGTNSADKKDDNENKDQA